MKYQDILPVAYVVAGFFTGLHYVRSVTDFDVADAIFSLISVFLWPLYWLTQI